MLWYHYTKRPPRNKYHIKYANIDLKGNSFILNPEPILGNSNIDTLFRIQFIKLAARRDYNLFKQYGYKRLDVSYFPDLIYDSIKHNPLLEITPKEIIFKTEEI